MRNKMVDFPKFGHKYACLFPIRQYLLGVSISFTLFIVL